MGSYCAQGEPVPSNDDLVSRNLISKDSTFHGIEKKENGEFYVVGSGIHSIFHNIMSRINEQSSLAKLLTLIRKYNVNLYFFSTVAYVCKGDGVLSEEEQSCLTSFAIRNDPDIEDSVIAEIKEGKDYTNECLEAYSKVYNEFLPNSTKEEKERYIHNIKQQLVLGSIITAAQDGLVPKEYDRVKEVAYKLGLTHDDIKEYIAIVKLEIELAKRLKKVLI